MTIFFLSDTHFHHKKILDYCARPFVDKFEQDRQLIKNWNDTVGPNDEVYHLGDFAFASKRKILEILEQLNGRIYLIRGNHDQKIKGEVSEKFGFVRNYYEIKIKDETGKQNQLVVMCHYPFESWNKKGRGSIHLHGHTHGKTSQMPCRIDVGVDSNNYRPLSEYEIISIANKQIAQFSKTNKFWGFSMFSKLTQNRK